MNTYQNIIGRVNYWLFLFVVFMLPFPQVILRYACVLWIFTWLLEGRWLRKPRLSFSRGHLPFTPFLLFGLWFLYKVMSVFWVADYEAWAWQMERYLTFALLVPIGIWGVNEYYKWTEAGKILVAGCVTAIPVYLLILIPIYYHPEIITAFQHEAEFNFKLPHWFAFVVDNISIFKHRLFLCSVELLGIIIAYQLWRNRLRVLLPSILIMSSIIPLSGSRQSILTGTALLIIGIIYSMPRPYRLRYGLVILLLGMFLGGGILKLHPRMQKFDLSAITELREVSYNHDIRFNIWGFALQSPEDYIAYGLGAGQSTQYLINHYQEAGFSYYAQAQLNSHNQYIEELMETGIIGLLLFLFAWLSIIFYTRGQSRQTAILFCALFMFNMLTDCMFGRFCGIALWAVGLMFILLQSNTQSNEQTTGNA